MSGGSIPMSGIPYVPTAEEIEQARKEGQAALQAHLRGVPVPNYNPAGNDNAATTEVPYYNPQPGKRTAEVNPIDDNLHNPGVINPVNRVSTVDMDTPSTPSPSSSLAAAIAAASRKA